jgi:hypothetical protein
VFPITIGSNWFNNATTTIARPGVFGLVATAQSPTTAVVPAGLPVVFRLDVTAAGGFTGNETVRMSNTSEQPNDEQCILSRCSSSSLSLSLSLSLCFFLSLFPESKFLAWTILAP